MWEVEYIQPEWKLIITIDKNVSIVNGFNTEELALEAKKKLEDTFAKQYNNRGTNFYNITCVKVRE